MAQEKQYSADDFKVWLEKSLGRFGKIENHSIITESHDGDIHRVRVTIFTDVHEFHITAVSGNNHSYLGCIASCRKTRAGEKQHRGNDLADGRLIPETWHSILSDIVSYEMVRVHHWESPKTDGIGADTNQIAV